MRRLRRRIAAGWDQVTIEAPIAFCDVDAMGMVWHGHYLRYVELAREALCAARGLSYGAMAAAGILAPLIRLQVDYLQPARLGERVQVRIAHVPGPSAGLVLLSEVAAAGRLLCVVETMQVFIGRDGVPFHPLPPPVVTFLAALARGAGPGAEQR
jgi:acyl-CoA thioester hydrolase